LYRFVNNRLLFPLLCCCHYDHTGCSATGSRGATSETSSEVSAGLGQLGGDSTLPLLDNLCVCVCYTMPMCVPLAVAVWSNSNLPGMDCTDCISPEVASHRSVCPHVYTHHPVLSESGFAGFTFDNCIWTGILPAVL